jgi:hypothetical protein
MEEGRGGLFFLSVSLSLLDGSGDGDGGGGVVNVALLIGAV